MARELVGDALLHAVALGDVEGFSAGALVVAEKQAAKDLQSLIDRSPLASLCRWWRAGVDRSLFCDPRTDQGGVEGFLELVLDPADPPVPFDDPTVVGIMQDQHAWYLSLVGPRHITCGAFIADAVRAAGSFIAFSASSTQEARWLAALDPWRRVAPGRLMRLPAGVFSRQAPPAGPGTQRMGSGICGLPG